MRAFIAVVDSGGFSAAARGSGRSKALMSKYVAELEEELGARLLNRNTRKLSLTEAGETVYEEAQDVLQRVEGILLSSQANGGTGLGLYVGAVTF